MMDHGTFQKEAFSKETSNLIANATVHKQFNVRLRYIAIFIIGILVGAVLASLFHENPVCPTVPAAYRLGRGDDNSAAYRSGYDNSMKANDLVYVVGETTPSPTHKAKETTVTPSTTHKIKETASPTHKIKETASPTTTSNTPVITTQEGHANRNKVYVSLVIITIAFLIK
eukprot:83812_1